MEPFSIDSKTSLLCLIGWPIKHSMSPIMHNAVLQKLKLNYVYLAFNVKKEELKPAINGIKALDIKGVNITIPHKETIIPYLDEIDPLAAKIGAVNTIKKKNGVLIGKNTDAEGAKKSLLDEGCTLSGKNVLVLGAGGASRAVCFALADDVDKIFIANRTEKRALSLAKQINKKTDGIAEGHSNTKPILERLISNSQILINTTPIGMHPKTDEMPLPENMLHRNLFVFDAIYNPLKTKLLKKAEKKGCRILGGLDMLVNQGALAFEYWTGKTPDTHLMKTIILEYLEENNAR
ncbi:MAG: shikimate dehydrogenase [Candidatus Lokiarchaeota archaeon]|nr:shikimate dehydrogenase [Candidatus Lokiarchaeota archaeon]